MCGSATHAVLNPQNRVRAYGSHHQCSLKKPPAPTADGFPSFQTASFSATTPHPTSRANPTSFHARNHSRNTSNGINCEPKRAKCAVSCWQSMADAATRQKRHGTGKGDFGRIGAVGKHGFAVKHAADLHAVKAACQLPLPRCVGQPAFKAVRVPHAVQRGVGSLKIGRNPSAALLGQQHGTGVLRKPVKQAVGRLKTPFRRRCGRIANR